MNRRLREVILQATARNTITAETRRCIPLESGGVLLGYREDRRIVVTHALVVSADIAHTNRYIRDDVQANALLRQFLASREADDPIGYIGEWHSHPAPCGPSNIDVRAIRAIASDTDSPIALIVYSPGHTPEFTGIIAARQRFARATSQEATVTTPNQAPIPLSPLPTGAVRGDGPVFISYRQSDGTDRANSLQGLLRAAGLVVWRDHSDLRAGTTTDRLEQALTAGLSAGVLVVTSDIAKSQVVKERELPRLLQLDEDPRFSLSIANEVPSPRSEERPDYSAPDRLLGLAPASTLGEKKQSNSRTSAGHLEIVRDLLMHRVEQLKPHIDTAGGVFTITTQTRPEPFAMDAGQSDLHIRIKPAAEGRLPSRSGLKDLQATLPLTSDAVRASGANVVKISGGMHLSVAFALGAALPETKIGHVEVTDLRGTVWSSNVLDDPHVHDITTEVMAGDNPLVSSGPAKIAVFVTLTENADETGFQRLIHDPSQSFNSVTRVSTTPNEPLLDAREAARLSTQIAREIKRLSAQFGRAEVHLAYHGPYTMAVLIGRLLNTLRTVIYEWDNPADTGPTYIPVHTLEVGVAGGPITKVY
ncbi:SAVED domain-containing protein [Kocuria rosea]|uniref:SAVED domain-containing protein n=1 Tax=Kocuria rosea TaxID=1275 RepID=UPI002B25102D|nr:SAVED domain-containing protein [Kocuria rosea]MEB2529150.1 SAVED domain-containing protein [Kocuria rosea]MEB2619653.1 SAVED domain-containing protein [Kocuria rosea]